MGKRIIVDHRTDSPPPVQSATSHTHLRRESVGGGIYQLIAAQATRDPGAVALLAPGRPPLSYDQLQAHLGETVRTLNAIGIGRGDRVALVLSV